MAMQDLLILGTGPHAQEMAEIVARMNDAGAAWNLLGYLAPDAQAAQGAQRGAQLNGLAVLGTYADMDAYPHAVCALEFGCNPPALLRERLISLIDPSTFVSRTARIGAGCVIYPNGYIGLNAALGDGVFVLSGSIINHDDHLEDGVTLASGVSLAGHVHVEAGSYLGQSCTVRQFVRIGRNSLIGMGSVVLRDVAPNSVMVGNPARRLRDRN